MSNRGRPALPHKIKSLVSENPPPVKHKYDEPADLEAFPEPPAYLNAYAQDEWNLAGSKLYELGIIKGTDLSLFAMYCDAYGNWRELKDLIKRMAGTENCSSDGMLIRGSSNGMETWKSNPAVRMASQERAEALRFASHFGLSPSLRAKLGIYEQDNPEDELDNILNS